MLRDLFSKSQGAESKKQVRHQNEDDEILPVFEEICSAQDNGAHERDKIGRGKERAERIKNPRHRFTWKNETGKENARQQKHHRHLQRLHLVFGIGPYEQTEAEQRKDIDQR